MRYVCFENKDWAMCLQVSSSLLSMSALTVCRKHIFFLAHGSIAHNTIYSIQDLLCAMIVSNQKYWDALQAHEYGEAFELTSNNRVDLNVMVDYAWPEFLTHAHDFVREVQVCCVLSFTLLRPCFHCTNVCPSCVQNKMQAVGCV